jgi:hypothetical protein
VLETLYAPANPPHLRVNALRLMSHRGRWTGIIPVLRALCDGDRRVASGARGHLRRWMDLQRRAYVSATDEERERFLAAVSQYGGCIDDDMITARLHTFR